MSRIPEGRVYDINTGRELHRTDNPSRTFLYYIGQLQRAGKEFYCVTAPPRKADYRGFLAQVEAMGVLVIYDHIVPQEQAFLIEGDPKEWRA